VALQVEHRRRQRPHQPLPAVEEQAVRELRRHLLWYSRGRRGGVAFRRGGTHVRTAAEVLALIDLQFPPGAPWELDAGWHPAQDGGGEDA
jgi:tRNA-dihydrouridine synthase B